MFWKRVRRWLRVRVRVGVGVGVMSDRTSEQQEAGPPLKSQIKCFSVAFCVEKFPSLPLLCANCKGAKEH